MSEWAANCIRCAVPLSHKQIQGIILLWHGGVHSKNYLCQSCWDHDHPEQVEARLAKAEKDRRKKARAARGGNDADPRTAKGG
jgi:hypothetical protein